MHSRDLPKSAWFYQLYEQAYLEDRGWLGERDEEASRQMTVDREQLEGGRLNRCDFGKKVLKALFYLRIVPAIFAVLDTCVGRPIAFVCRMMAKPFIAVGKNERLVSGLVTAGSIMGIAVLIAFVITLSVGVVCIIHDSRKEAESIARTQQRQKAEWNAYVDAYENSERGREDKARELAQSKYAAEIQLAQNARMEKQEQRRIRKEAEAHQAYVQAVQQEKENRRLWEAGHPAEVAEMAAAKRMEDERSGYSDDLYNLQKTIRENREFVGKLEGYFQWYLGFVGLLVGIECLLGLALLWVRSELWFKRNLNELWRIVDRGIDWLLTWLVVLPIITINESRTRLWLVRKYEFWKKIVMDTTRFLVECARDIKNRVCPFLNPVDE